MTITDGEIDKLRDEQDKYLPDSVTIRRRVYVGGETGAEDFTTQNLATDVAARIRAGFGAFRTVSDRFQAITAYTISFTWDQDVRVGDQIVDADSVVYEVRDVRDQSSYHTLTTCLTDRIH